MCKPIDARSTVSRIALLAASLSMLAFPSLAQESQPQPAKPETPSVQTQPAPEAAPDTKRGAETPQQRNEERPRLTETDRQAFLEARIAAIKAGLMLTEAQQSLWTPMENTIREVAKQRMAMRETMRSESAPTNPVARMKRAGEMQVARGEALKKYAEALEPLYASLSEDQKRRARMLINYGRQAMTQPGEDTRQGGDQRYRDRMHEHRHHGRGHGMRQQQRGGEDERRGGMGERWRDRQANPDHGSRYQAPERNWRDDGPREHDWRNERRGNERGNEMRGRSYDPRERDFERQDSWRNRQRGDDNPRGRGQQGERDYYGQGWNNRRDNDREDERQSPYGENRRWQ